MTDRCPICAELGHAGCVAKLQAEKAELLEFVKLVQSKHSLSLHKKAKQLLNKYSNNTTSEGSDE